MSQNDLRLHFGLGKATSAEVRVKWLDGKIESFQKVSADNVITIEEGKGIVGVQPYTHDKP